MNLQTLDRKPLSWSELHAANEAWWARERAREAQERVVWMPRRKWTRTEVREWRAS